MPETAQNVAATTEAPSPFNPVDDADKYPTRGERTRNPRTPKIDALIAEAKDAALQGVLSITSEVTIGSAHYVRGEEERLSTHLFECAMSGYRGWFWFATLARAPRSKRVTVCEVGLLPGSDALLAPQWLPWSERILPGDSEERDAGYEEVDTVESDDVLDVEDIDDLVSAQLDEELAAADEAEEENS